MKNILTKEELDYLKAVMSFEKDKPIAIVKTGDYCGGEYIYIKYDAGEYDVIALRTFKEGTKFKDMEVDKEYTLKELGLNNPIEKKYIYFVSYQVKTVNNGFGIGHATVPRDKIIDSDEDIQELQKTVEKAGQSSVILFYKLLREETNENDRK